MNHLERGFDNYNQWWRYALVLLLTIILTPLLSVIVTLVTDLALSGGPKNNGITIGLYTPAEITNPSLKLAFMVIPFVLGLFTLTVLIRLIHKRSLIEIINGTRNYRWTKCLLGFGIWFVLIGGLTLCQFVLSRDEFIFQGVLATIVPLAIVSLLLIPLQAMFEEVLLRGYLLQGFATLTRSRILGMAITSIFFGLMHSFNPEIQEYGFWIVMPAYITFGLLFGVVTIADDGAEYAIGAHAANNVFLSIFVTTKASAIQTPALLEQINIDPVRENILLLFIGLLFFWILYRFNKWRFSELLRNDKLVRPET